MEKKKRGGQPKPYKTKTVSERVLLEHHAEAKAKMKKVLKPFKPKP